MSVLTYAVSSAWSFGIAVAGIAFLIFLHELGHFAAAKALGGAVREFAVGIGKRLPWCSWLWGETEFTIRRWPVAGFVRVVDLRDPNDIHDTLDAVNNSPDPDARAGLLSERRSVWMMSSRKRIFFLLAGPVASIAAGFLLYLGGGLCFGNPTEASSAVVLRVKPKFPASTAGMIRGDRVVRINDTPIGKPSEASRAIQSAPDGPLRIGLVRKDKSIELSVVPKTASNGKVLGLQWQEEWKRVSAAEAVSDAGTRTTAVTIAYSDAFFRLFTGRLGVENLGGPIAIYGEAKAQASDSLSGFVFWLAGVSIMLGVMNMLPFPILDGGRILMATIEGIRRKRFSLVFEQRAVLCSACLLLGITLIVSAKDVYQLFA